MWNALLTFAIASMLGTRLFAAAIQGQLVEGATGIPQSEFGASHFQ